MPTTRRGVLRQALAALYGLVNVSTVTDVATGGVHHAQAPQNTVLPIVILQSPASIAWDTMQNPGEAAEVQIASVAAGPDYGPALALNQLVVQVVDGERPTIDADHLCIALQFRSVLVVPEPDLVNGVTVWRAVSTFRMLLDQVN